jgi:hypothetical protein
MNTMHTLQEATEAFAADRAMHEANGAIMLSSVKSYIPDGWRKNYQLAMDAQPALSTDPNSALPFQLTNFIDPQVYKTLFAENKAAIVFGEEKRGTWVDQTAMFPVTENGGEVTSYGDYNENGHTTVNMAWPQRQAYLFQVMIEYGELEMERAGLGRINWVSEQQVSAALVSNKFQNLSYLYGISGLENFGWLNDPNLNAPLAPATKSYGGTKWIVNGVVKATAYEIYQDIQSMYLALVNQSQGLVEMENPMKLVMSPLSSVALTAVNEFGLDVAAFLKKNFPNIKFETSIQYGALTASNPQGYVGGEIVQLVVDSTEGQKTGFCAFNEKMRSHKLIPATSSYKQKITGGTWGAIVRQPFGVSQMLGV